MVKGERHTGTTFMQALLRHTFPDDTRLMREHFHAGCDPHKQPRLMQPDDTLLCCSKHGALGHQCDYAPPKPLLVLLLRNPYAWLSANFFIPYGGCGTGNNFSTFLRGTYTTFGMCKPWRRRSSPMAVWNEQALSFQRRANTSAAVLVRDRDLFTEHLLLSKLREIGRRLSPRDQTRVSYALPHTLPRLRGGQKQWSRTSYHAEEAKYRLQPWRKMFTATDLYWVNSQLSQEAMVGFSWVRDGCVKYGVCADHSHVAKDLARISGRRGSTRAEERWRSKVTAR
jgi:hypothetical protein